MKVDYCFVIVNYKVPQDSLDFIDSVNETLDKKNYLICIVDNDGSFSKYKNIYKNVWYIKSKTNVDYLSGLGLGYNFIKKKFPKIKVKYFFLSNADIKLTPSFKKNIDSINPKIYDCIAPNIINLNTKLGDPYQNPYLLKKPTEIYLKFMKIIYSNYLFFVIYEWLSIQKSKITKRTQKKDNQQKKIYSPYGSFIGFSTKFISKFNFDHKCEGGGIELIFSYELNNKKIDCYYFPNLSVFHKNKSSYSFLKKRDIFIKVKNTYEYIYNLFLNENYIIFVKREGDSGGIYFENNLFKKIKEKYKHKASHILINKNKIIKILNLIILNLKLLLKSNKFIFFPMGCFFFLNKKNYNIVIFHHKDELKMKLNLIISFLYFQILFMNIKKINKIICVSKYWKKQLINHGIPENKILILYNEPVIYKPRINNLKFLKNSKFVYLGIYEKFNFNNFHLISKFYKEKKMKLIFSSININKKLDDETFILKLDKNEYNWILKNAYEIYLDTNINEGWSRVAHESALLNQYVYTNKIGGLSELHKIANFNSLNAIYSKRKKTVNRIRLTKYIEQNNLRSFNNLFKTLDMNNEI